MSASSIAIAVSAMKPGGERPEDDAGDDVADDRGQPDALGDVAAQEGGDEADGDRGDENGLVVHGCSR